MVADPRFIPRPGRVDDPSCAFSLAERDRRWGLARAEMDRRGIDCLFVVGAGGTKGNARWLDNGDYSDRHLVFPASTAKAPTILWGFTNWARWYLENSWEGFEFRPTEGSVSVAAAETIHDLGLARGRIGIVGLVGSGLGAEGSIPYMTFRNLQLLLPDADLVDATDILARARMVKSEEEIAFIEKSAEISNVEIDTLLKHLRPGMRESAIVAEVMYEGLKAGNELGRDQWFLISSGFTGYPVNRRPTDRMIGRDEMVFTGHYTRFGGYYCHPHMAISVGRMNDEYRAMRDMVYDATQRALEMLKPGTPWADFDRAIDEIAVKGEFYHEITQAHCVGLDGIEAPVTEMIRGAVPEKAFSRIGGSIRDNPEYRALLGNRKPLARDLLIEPGMSVALEIKVAKEDRMFLEFGPHVVVGKDGPRVLTPGAMDVVEL